MKILNHNARRYPALTGEFVLLAVLVKQIDGLAVYAGIVPDNSIDDPHYDNVKGWAVSMGNHLSFTEAQSHFPGLKEEDYA